MPNTWENSIACYVLTAQGLPLAHTLAGQLPLVIFAAERLRAAVPERTVGAPAAEVHDTPAYPAAAAFCSTAAGSFTAAASSPAVATASTFTDAQCCNLTAGSSTVAAGFSDAAAKAAPVATGAAIFSHTPTDSAPDATGAALFCAAGADSPAVAAASASADAQGCNPAAGSASFTANPPAAAPVHFFSALAACVAETFSRFRAHLFLTASGIAVRCIAPHLVHKSLDPAVLVLEQEGRFVIPLLAGHWGGGNALAIRIATLCGGQAVITTATDTAGLPAIDVLAHTRGCRVLDWPAVKTISATLLAGEPVPLYDPHHIFAEQDIPPRYFPRCAAVPERGPAVLADWHGHPPRAGLLRLAPRRLTLGIGCRRGVSAEEIRAALHTVCRAADIVPEAVCQLASIDAKRDERGLLEAAAQLNLPLRWFSAAALAAVAVPHPSPKASAVFATPALGVCEGAALLAAGAGGQLILPKQTVQARITVACAASLSPFDHKEQP